MNHMNSKRGKDTSKANGTGEGLRILARMIARRLERERQQPKLNAINDNIDGNKVEHAKCRILREKKEGKR